MNLALRLVCWDWRQVVWSLLLPVQRTIALTSLVSSIPSHLPNNIPTHVVAMKCASHPSHPSGSDPISLLDMHWLFCTAASFSITIFLFQTCRKKNTQSLKTVPIDMTCSLTEKHNKDALAGPNRPSRTVS